MALSTTGSFGNTTGVPKLGTSALVVGYEGGGG